LFGEQRLETVLTKTGGMGPRQLIDAIDQAIQEFSAAAPPPMTSPSSPSAGCANAGSNK
jgi:hypothetical protein